MEKQEKKHPFGWIKASIYSCWKFCFLFTQQASVNLIELFQSLEIEPVWHWSQVLHRNWRDHKLYQRLPRSVLVVGLRDLFFTYLVQFPEPTIMSSNLQGGGHIDFDAAPVGVGVSMTLSCLRNILWSSGGILTKFSRIHNWDITKNWLDFGNLDIIFKVTAIQKLKIHVWGHLFDLKAPLQVVLL